ncbi:spermine synthase [Coralloluteibacterium stylophorae]|uniref:spermine/spermidine synthase domain-containing protein n=1 Tax=Coralloluteibacterium stylophorae TaxID=1776034 RepID=UPI003083F621
MLGLFVLSGFAGLVYQALWSHYLGLTLGHAAYAQTLVLAIFMGGMALGAWAVGRRGLRWRRLLLAYAVAEGLIGLFGLAFHPLFLGYTALSQDLVLPALGDGALARLYPWVSGALLILPACVLLGATFPLLSAGVLRLAPAEDARVLGGLYFANSIGAAGGALVATFVLLPAVGMPGAVVVAGACNLLVAGGAWWVSRVWEGGAVRAGALGGSGAGVGAEVASSASGEVLDPGVRWDDGAGGGARQGAGGAGPAPLGRLLLAAAFLSGAFSFVYEIGWVRMLNQALGTTLHSFELMLAAFLLGLAFGGLWVRRRGRRIGDALVVAGFAQLWMGLAALLSVLLFARSFEWVGWLVRSLPRDDAGYALYALGSAAISLAVMFPAAFFAGMTLPLFTMALLRAGAGESGIGRIYAANTLGAIAGVLLMVHALIPLVGVRVGVGLAALGDAAVGVWLLARAPTVLPIRRVALSCGIVAAAALASFAFGRPDPREQVSGVFRSGVPSLHQSADVAFLRDGKTATVGIVRNAEADSAAITSNGKSDAAMVLDLAQPPRTDELTMTLIGTLPLLMHPAPEAVGVIGWGSGLTTHTLLGSTRVGRVETVEIEPVVFDAARLFGARVARAYQDPRSQVVFEDARTFFAAGNRRYDVIVSEPSNPWVSGVASLFTAEFYRFLRAHLAADGLLLQWLQAYEIDDRLIATMLAALLETFPDAELYLANDVDLVVVAHAGAHREPDYARLADGPPRIELERVGLGNGGEVALRRIAGGEVLRTFVRAWRAPPHSDFHPTVALQAPATRFRGSISDTFQNLVDNGMPVLDVLEGRVPVGAGAGIVELQGHRFVQAHHAAVRVAALLRTGRVPEVAGGHAGSASLDAERLLELSREPVRNVTGWAALAAASAAATIGHLPADDLEGVWLAPTWIDAQAQPEAVRALLAMWAAAARRDVRAMHTAGERVLRLPPGLPAAAREQALVIAQLGAIGSGAPREVETLQRIHGNDIPASERMRMVRHLLRVWAGTQPAS